MISKVLPQTSRGGCVRGPAALEIRGNVSLKDSAGHRRGSRMTHPGRGFGVGVGVGLAVSAMIGREPLRLSSWSIATHSCLVARAMVT